MLEIFESAFVAAAALLSAGLLVALRRPGALTARQKKSLRRIFGASVLLILLLAADGAFDALGGAGRWARLGCYLAVYALIGYDILSKAAKGVINGRLLDENFLMAVASLGALGLAVYQDGDYMESIAVMLFYQIGEWFESYAVGKSRRSISELMDIRPDYANVERGGGLERVDPGEVGIGGVIVVQPGEKVPIDGLVIEGSSALDTTALTGESLPREVKAGDEVLSGCINMSGVLRVRTTKEFGESTVSKILDLVENASSRKSRSEDFISRFARVYTPAVCGSALALAVIPPLVRVFALGLPGGWETWLYRALSFLVASCPCALVISIPLSFFAGIGGASRQGVLVKGSNYLEALSKTSTVVFDKTGTLTKGVFEVNGIHHSQYSDEELVEYAALAESASSHPISKSLQRAYGREIDRSRVTDIRELGGEGVTAVVDGHSVAAGNDKLMDAVGVNYIECHGLGTVIHMAIDGEYAGHILISDVIKPRSAQAVSALRAAGVKETVMLSGDSARVAEGVGKELGIGRSFGGLMPGDKVAKVEELLAAQEPGGCLAFVGDGINDAPVLSRADIGIAMGAMGSDAAIEAADVVLMDDDPMKIVTAIRIARKCLRIVYENIVGAISIKIACLALVAAGAAGMWLAVFADVGVMVIAVLNAIRARQYGGRRAEMRD